MKVIIGPYPSWIGPYQIAETLLFWLDKDKDDRVHNFGNWLAENKQGKPTLLTKLCEKIDKLRKRTTYIKIDKFDTWSMDHTLALITLPMLKQLKATKHGSPCVDDLDVPGPLRSTAPGARDRCENDYDIDDNHHYRWDYVLEEMIFAFTKKLDENWDAEFWHGTCEGVESVSAGYEVYNPVTDKMEAAYELKFKGNRDCDWDARAKVQERITNGFRLFGKYYEALWD